MIHYNIHYTLVLLNLTSDYVHILICIFTISNVCSIKIIILILDRFSTDENGFGYCARLENPKSIITITKNKRLTLQETVEAGEEIVQIAPQEINMRLRVGETTKIRFEVANAKTYPVDLYYLMDLSNSMSDDRDTIVS